METIKKWSPPRTKKDVQSFLWYANYHWDHLSNLAEVALPLIELTKNKSKFEWKKCHQDAFDKIKQSIINSVTLVIPSADEPFILDTDASDTAVAAELIHLHSGKECVVACASKALTPAQRRYCTTRKELLALITFTRQFRNYLLARKCTEHIITVLLGYNGSKT